jgi:hypothetical protein
MAPPSLDAAGAPAPAWRRFGLSFAAAALAAAGGLYGFVLALDPYGLRAGPGRTPGPIMDLNQRFMYPQIVRSRRYDAAVFGTSTIRLLDPQRLGALFGARFANLGLNAGTPWEQAQLAGLFLRHVPRPAAMIFGLDTSWCEPDADRRRLTPRAFPPWLYDEDPLNDLAGLANMRSVEIASRVALNRLGLLRERIRGDGYEVFVPPDEAYDLARARTHIREGVGTAPAERGPPAPERDRAASPMPALDWLEALLAAVPDSTVKILAFMPIHAAAQPAPGSRAFAHDEACKARTASLAKLRGAAVVDFRRVSPVTTDDSNYWDALHYRLGIAARIAEGLRQAYAEGREDPDGFYRILAPAPARP